MEGMIMPRIKIMDIPMDQKISRQEMKRIRGGSTALYYPTIDLNDPVSVMFNPEKVTIKKTIPWKDQKEDYDTK